MPLWQHFVALPLVRMHQLTPVLGYASSQLAVDCMRLIRECDKVRIEGEIQDNESQGCNDWCAPMLRVTPAAIGRHLIANCHDS